MTTNYVLYWRSFRGLLLRDLRVLRREVIPFLIRTVMNPLMFVFVFTYLFPKMGQGFQSSAASGFGTLILPGLLAVGIFIQESWRPRCRFRWKSARPARFTTA